MTGITCHRCGRLMAATFPVCPHCGAPQDERSRAASAQRHREALLAVVPAILGPVLGWLVFRGEWGIAAGLAVGLLAGVGLVAVRYARRSKR